MSFTAGMTTTQETTLVSTADREDVLVQNSTGGVVRVRALTDEGRKRVHAELQLLASLDITGVHAVPEVLEVDDAGYTREAGTPVSLNRTGDAASSRGRRAAAESTPGTRERQNLARARTHLDALISALHDRGWVLGAPAGRGLAARYDGTVTLYDLSGLHIESSTVARLDDRLWMDTVLCDHDRTLRRRIETVTDAPDTAAASTDESVAGGTDSTADIPLPQLRRPTRRADRENRGSWVLRSLQPQRDQLAAVAAVVLAGLVLGVGAWSLLTPGVSAPTPSAGPQQHPATSSDSPTPRGQARQPPAASAPPPESVLSNTPEITDAGALAAELALARHRYVTGTADDPVASQGSSARAQDDQVRAAYAGLTVSGGEPRIHEAVVLEQSAADGTAVLSVEASTEEHTTVTPDGVSHRVPATEPATVQLFLRWDGTTWWVEGAAPM